MNTACGTLHAKGRFAQSIEINRRSFRCLECQGLKWNCKDCIENVISIIPKDMISIIIQPMASDAVKEYVAHKSHPTPYMTLQLNPLYAEFTPLFDLNSEEVKVWARKFGITVAVSPHDAKHPYHSSRHLRLRVV